MKSKKTTRRALLTSMLSLLICVSMLVGSTFAWFTDSVTSANNIIKSGNLDVELYYQVEGQTDWTKVTEDTSIFMKDALWEPGHTEVVKLKVVNEGTLALKYQLGVNVASETESTNVKNEPLKLSDHIKFGIVDGAQTYTRDQAVAAVDATATALKEAYNSGTVKLEAKNDTDSDEKIVTLVVYMPTTVGNEANYAKGAAVPTINLGINLFATQVEAEEDSFGEDYDKDAWNKNFKVYNANDLQTAIDAGETNIVLMDDIVVTEPIVIPAPAATTYSLRSNGITINLNGKKISGATADALLVNNGILTLVGGTIENTAVNGGATISNKGTLILDDAEVVGAPIAADPDSGYPAYCISNSGNLTVEEGTVVSADRGCLYLSGTGETTINGGTFTNNDISAKRSTFTSHVVVVGYGANNKLTINDGTFKHLHTKTSGGVVINNWSAVTVDITGGNFSGGNYFGKWDNLSDYGYGSTKTPFSVTGGTFTGLDTNYVAEGYKAIENDGKYFVVSENVNGIFTADDLKNLTSGNYDLFNDISLTGTTIQIPADAVTTLNLNGHTISGTFENTGNSNKVLFDVKGSLTVNGEGTITMSTTGINMGWSAMGCTICVNGGDLTVNNATIRNEGGTDMSYALDTNPWNSASNEVLDVVLNNATIESTYFGVRVRDNGPYLVKLVANDSTIDEIWYQEYSEGDNVNKGNYGVLVEVHLNNTTADVKWVQEVGVLFINEKQAVTTAEDLQTALDNAANGATITLAADITGNVTATQKSDVKITLDGNGYTFNGILTVDGKSATYTTAGLTIRNVVFKADAIDAEACINLGEKDNDNTRYTCNVTVDNCTFDVPGAVGVKSYTGGDKKLTVTGCTATANCHSLIQAKGIDGILVEKCKVYSKNGLNFNNSDNVVVSGCEVDVKGYAVRFGESSGGTGAAETYAIKDCTLKSANNDGDATIILRGTADYATLTIENTTIVGTPGITNTATDAEVVTK